MPIVHDLDPFIFQIHGDFGLRWYSLPYILGFLLVYRSLVRAGERGEPGGLSREAADRFVVYAMTGALVGARFFHVFVFEFDRYGLDPLAWIAVWRGGLAFHGGLLGVALATSLFAYREGIRIYDLTDRLVVPVAIALGFGRIANFINAEMWGTPYHGPLCVDYSRNEHLIRPPAGCRHPTQFYEMTKNWALAGLLVVLGQRPLRPGVLTWTFIGLYGLVRFFLMFVRDEVDVWGTLTLSQIFSALMAMTAAAALGVVTIRPRRPLSPA